MKTWCTQMKICEIKSCLTQLLLYWSQLLYTSNVTWERRSHWLFLINVHFELQQLLVWQMDWLLNNIFSSWTVCRQFEEQPIIVKVKTMHIYSVVNVKMQCYLNNPFMDHMIWSHIVLVLIWVCHITFPGYLYTEHQHLSSSGGHQIEWLT